MRIAICPICDIVIETIMMTRVIAPQLAIEKKVPDKWSGPILDGQSSPIVITMSS